MLMYTTTVTVYIIPASSSPTRLASSFVVLLPFHFRPSVFLLIFLSSFSIFSPPSLLILHLFFFLLSSSSLLFLVSSTFVFTIHNSVSELIYAYFRFPMMSYLILSVFSLYFYSFFLSSIIARVVPSCFYAT